MEELLIILEKFAGSGWDLIAIPSKGYLDGNGTKEDLINQGTGRQIRIYITHIGG